MKRLFVALSLIGCVSQADMMMKPWTAQLALRSTASDGSAANCTGTCTANTQTLFAAGATTAFNMANNVDLTTGGLITQRGFSSTTAGTEATVNYTYLDVPVLPEYHINDMFSAYAGVVVGLKASRSCSGTCTGVDDKSLVTPIQVGANYIFNPAWRANLTYETGSAMATAPGSEIKTSNVIALGAGYTF